MVANGEVVTCHRDGCTSKWTRPQTARQSKSYARQVAETVIVSLAVVCVMLIYYWLGESMK